MKVMKRNKKKYRSRTRRKITQFLSSKSPSAGTRAALSLSAAELGGSNPKGVTMVVGKSDDRICGKPNLLPTLFGSNILFTA